MNHKQTQPQLMSLESVMEKTSLRKSIEKVPTDIKKLFIQEMSFRQNKTQQRMSKFFVNQISTSKNKPPLSSRQIKIRTKSHQGLRQLNYKKQADDHFESKTNKPINKLNILKYQLELPLKPLQQKIEQRNHSEDKPPLKLNKIKKKPSLKIQQMNQKFPTQRPQENIMTLQFDAEEPFLQKPFPPPKIIKRPILKPQPVVDAMQPSIKYIRLEKKQKQRYRTLKPYDARQHRSEKRPRKVEEERLCGWQVMDNPLQYI